MSRVTTHVLDTSAGRPLAGVNITLEGDGTKAQATTGENGRAAFDTPLSPGTFVLTFDVPGERFRFFMPVQVRFTIDSAEEHYHIPLLVSPFGYSTYRGS